ncbi:MULTISPECIES: site-2 protease family protein [Sporosarcina]|uniref:Metalloprotease n=1 Tax=Sporosarcina contaminans TaxID=633403 RepID=A0ABW3U2W5_9BACL
MKFRLHPILLPFFLFLAFTGGLAFYALIFISLLLHEAGHIIAARINGMSVRSVTIMPYGGEMRIAKRYLYSKKARFFVAIGGPIATLIVLLAAKLIPFVGDDQVVQIQMAILCLNVLPVLPLDGGQAICALMEKSNDPYRIRSAYYLFSIGFFLAVIIIIGYWLPQSLLYVLLALFLLSQNIVAFRFRKYEFAYENLMRNRLT